MANVFIFARLNRLIMIIKLFRLKRFYLFLAFFTFIFDVSAQTSDKKFGIRYAYTYNHISQHHGLYFVTNLDNVDVFVGPEVSVVKPEYINSNLFEDKTLGAGLGFRYRFWDIKDRLRMYGQLHFSAVPIRVYDFQMGPYNAPNKRVLKIENTFSLGLEYDMGEFWRLSFGAGFGSRDGFFLILSSFMPHGHVGLELRF
jgi:hypothetical protein